MPVVNKARPALNTATTVHRVRVTQRKKNDCAGTVSTIRPLYTPFQVDVGRGCAVAVATHDETAVEIRAMVLGCVAAYDSNCSLGSNRLWGT
jgi:hypothetical protein